MRQFWGRAAVGVLALKSPGRFHFQRLHTSPLDYISTRVNVGIISDTHGLLRPEALVHLHGSDYIIHAGDVGSHHVLPALRKIAPVHAIRGNVDVEPWTHTLPLTLTLEFDRVKLLVIHNRAETGRLPADIRVVVFGHTHQPLIEEEDDVMYFNPGSAGPRRFKLPISLGRIVITGEVIEPQLITIG